VSVLLAGPAAAAELAYRQVDPDNFVFRLRNDTALSESVAQATIANAARSACGQRQPRLGKYRFESKEPLDGAGAAPTPASFEFIQDVACVAAPGPAPSVAAAPVFSKEEKDKAAADVLDRTERHFRLLGEGRVDEAYKDLDLATGTWNEAAWKQARRELQALAGALHQINITKVTVYENPAGAPAPGLYVAADYRNTWLNVPLHCGYLVWHRSANGEFLVTREETGHVTAAQLQAMPAQQQQQVAQALRCR
jgi:hypothetical protein